MGHRYRGYYGGTLQFWSKENSKYLDLHSNNAGDTVRAVSRSISPPVGVNLISSGSPHGRCTPMGRTCGEPDEIKKNTHPEYVTALSREQDPQAISSNTYSQYASRAVQFHPHGVQSDFVWLPARTPHVGPQYVWCLTARRNQEKYPPETFHRSFSRAGTCGSRGWTVSCATTVFTTRARPSTSPT